MSVAPPFRNAKNKIFSHSSSDLIKLTIPLKIIEANHLRPVLSDLRKIETLTDVDKIEDVLLEAGASKSHAGLQIINN